jgi:hypothetical protein
LLIVLLLVARTEALQGLGGYARPNASRAFANFTSGLDRVFRLVPADRPWQMVASWFATLLPVAALVCWRPVRHDVRFALGAGVAIAVLFNLPFVLVTKVEQMHLVALGAAVVLSASALALAELLRVRAFALAVTIAVAAGAAAMAAVARDISTDFDPYGPIVLSHDRIVQQWVAVPHELREYLSQKREHGRLVPANPVDTLDLVLFGVHPPETDPGGLRVRWMSANRTEILVAARARELLIPLRHEAGAFGEPASVEIFANGRRVDSLQLADGGWRMSRIALPPGGIRPLWRTHRVIVSIARAWVPARIIPGSTDTRVLGLQIGEIQLR